MLFNAVVMNFPTSTFFKILSIMQSVHCQAGFATGDGGCFPNEICFEDVCIHVMKMLITDSVSGLRRNHGYRGAF